MRFALFAVLIGTISAASIGDACSNNAECNTVIGGQCDTTCKCHDGSDNEACKNTEFRVSGTGF